MPPPPSAPPSQLAHHLIVQNLPLRGDFRRPPRLALPAAISGTAWRGADVSTPERFGRCAAPAAKVRCSFTKCV